MHHSLGVADVTITDVSGWWLRCGRWRVLGLCCCAPSPHPPEAREGGALAGGSNHPVALPSSCCHQQPQEDAEARHGASADSKSGSDLLDQPRSSMDREQQEC